MTNRFQGMLIQTEHFDWVEFVFKEFGSTKKFYVGQMHLSESESSLHIPATLLHCR